MAYTFNGSYYLKNQVSSLGLTAYPMTFAAWVNPTSTHTGHVMGINDSNNVGHNMLYLSNTGYNRTYSRALSPATASLATASSSYSTSTWQHMAAVYTSSVSRTAYYNGGSAVTDTGSVVFDTGQDNFSMGARLFSGGVDFTLSAKIGEAAAWSVVLTATEVGLLAAGFSPLLIRPESLVAYWPLLSDFNDWGPGGFHLTSVGVSVPSADHPAIIHAAPPIFVPIFVSGSEESRDITLPGVGGYTVFPVAESIYNLGIIMEPLPVAAGEHPGKLINDDYDAQRGDTKAYELPDKLMSDDTEDGEDTYVQETFTGLLRPPFEEQFWFDRAHLLPRIAQGMGTIVSVQTFDVELYNADEDDTITISSITDNLGTGISIAGVPAVPFDLGPRENVDAVVTIDTVGSLTIDASYTFHQSTGETYTIYITGTRIVMFPIRPEAPMREHLIFDTKVLTAIDGSEQRIANRKAPRSMFEFTIKDERKMMELLLMDRQAKICAVPAWHEPSFISSAVTTGDSTVNVNTTDYANFYVGGYAIVFRDQYTYDALEIQSMNATSLTFISPVSNDYATKVQVMPLMIAYFNHNVAASKGIYNEHTFNLQLKVDATDNDIADASAFNTYDGKVFLDGPNLINGQLAEVIEKQVLVLDNVTGAFVEFSKWDRSKRKSAKGLKTNDRQELWEWRQLLHFLKGQQVSFYIPTFTKDLIPNQKLVNTSSTFTMDNIGYTTNARDRAPKDFFRLILKDGTELTRTVLGSAEVSAAVEQLTVDSPWPYDIEVDDIERIDFLEKVRINVDDVVITHYNALGQSKTFIPTKEVFD